MTRITLNLTLEELKQIDKYVELNDETRPLFDKIKNAYPRPTTLYDVIENWWSDIFTVSSTDDMETCIDTLVDRIETWLPKEQSAAGSQNVDVEFLVDGFNDCLKEIKGKLR